MHKTLFGMWIHEWLFIVMYALALFKLSQVGMLFSLHGGFYLVMLAVAVFLVRFDNHTAQPWRRRTRLFYYPLAMNLVYFHFGTAVSFLAPQRVDLLLQRVDVMAFGGQGDFYLQPLYHPLLTDWMAVCYSIFIPYITIAFISYAFKELDVMKSVYQGVFTVYGIGFICYLLVPAEGPYVFQMSPFAHEGVAGILSQWIHEIIASGSNHMDVFPSLHCAVSFYLLVMDKSHFPRRFFWLGFPVVNLWFSTVYLGYHYLIDVVCGMGLAVSVYAFYRYWAARSKERRPVYSLQARK